jgi:pimeloyl-ACP methyl ester carboxylesterase
MGKDNPRKSVRMRCDMKIIQFSYMKGSLRMLIPSGKSMRQFRQLCAVSLIVVFLLFLNGLPGAAQQTCERIMEQDPGINNLVAPEGHVAAPRETLGNWEKVGVGSQAMILIPGLGFGSGVFDEFMASRAEDFTMYAVTLPGFGGTSAPPVPSEEISFGDQTWTNGALKAIERLIKEEGISRPILIGHWLTGTQLALRLALRHPENTKAVILIAGSARFVPTDTTQMPANPPLEWRVASIDKYLAPQWFKIVTRETWDDNNFLPGDYAVNPVRGLRLWREAARPPLYVWVRYLCEFYAQDITLDLDNLAVPVLLVKPGLEGNYFDPGNNYLQAYCHASWDKIQSKTSQIEITTIPNSRLCIWFDQPEKLNVAIDRFLESVD